MSSFLRTAVAVALALAAVQSTAEAQAQAKPKQDRNRIDVEEIRSRPVTTVHQLIKSRRAHWLSVRGQSTLQTRSTRDPYTDAAVTIGAAAEIVVYIDNARQGSPEVLRSISTDEIDSLEYFNAQAATQRFGTGHAYGAIIVHRRVR